MGEKVTIPVEVDVDLIRRFQNCDTRLKVEDYDAWATEKDDACMAVEGLVKAAVLRFELQWEPSEQDVTDYIDAFYGRSTSMSTRRRAAEAMKAHRRNGWDSVPRRIEGTVNDG